MNIKSIFEKANDGWNDAFNSRNTQLLASLYDEKAILSPGDGKTLVGRAEIEGLFKAFVENGVHHHTLEILECGGSENVIYQVSKWNANGAEVEGNTPSFGGITMGVMVKNSDGIWMITSHVWNMGN
jgi:ketosteroid isomerase-like protein